MARYVVMEFDDNAQAEAFVAKINSDPTRKFRVRWLFAQPRKFCECPAGATSRDGKAIVKGEKLGWWVHNECGRPITGNYQSPYNLLDPDLAIKLPSQKTSGWMFGSWLGKGTANGQG